MQRILIASKNVNEMVRFRGILEKTLEVRCMSAPDLPAKSAAMYDLLLMDHSFTDNSGIDYITELLSTVHMPVLYLAPAEDQRCAIEAIRAGAFNYIVKSGQYEEIFPIAISEAISRFNQQKQMKTTITVLKMRIAELEERLGSLSPAPAKETSQETAGKEPGKARNIVEEIVNRFRQGEINLPSLPRINAKFQELVDKGADYGQISELLKQDIAITSKLIMVSNSPLYRGVDMNRTLEHAVSRLGIGVTQQYVNAISNRALYTVSQKKYVPLIERLWRHSLSCAYVCQEVVGLSKEGLQLNNDPFVLGLLHDIGKLILIQVVSELEVKGKLGQEIAIEEVIKIAETYHGQFGSALLKRWNFSHGYTDAALYHDNPAGADPISKELLVVHFSNALVNELGFVFTDGQVPEVEPAQSAQLLKVDADTVAGIRKKAVEYMENVGVLLC